MTEKKRAPLNSAHVSFHVLSQFFKFQRIIPDFQVRMAKSLRSKFKRKVRAIARTKKEPKTAAFLQKAMEKRDEYEKADAGNSKLADYFKLLI